MLLSKIIVLRLNVSFVKRKQPFLKSWEQRRILFVTYNESTRRSKYQHVREGTGIMRNAKMRKGIMRKLGAKKAVRKTGNTRKGKCDWCKLGLCVWNKKHRICLKAVPAREKSRLRFRVRNLGLCFFNSLCQGVQATPVNVNVDIVFIAFEGTKNIQQVLVNYRISHHLRASVLQRIQQHMVSAILDRLQ